MNKFFAATANDIANWILDRVTASIIAGWMTIAFFVVLIAIRFILAGVLVIPAYDINDPGLPTYLAVMFVLAIMVWGWNFNFVKALIEKATK